MRSPTQKSTSSAPFADQLSARAYREIRGFVYAEAGIELGPSRQKLVTSRLQRRLLACQVSSFDDYADILCNRHNHAERQTAIDLLSTNETYFFREAHHFEVLRTQVLDPHPSGDSLRIWSAACSSGEEAYSIAMVLDNHCAKAVDWEVLGSDVSSRMINQAQRGLYPLARIDTISPEDRKSSCLLGVGDYEGYFLIDRKLRERTRYKIVNLVKPLPELGLFDAIFFRNALIYFDEHTRQSIVRHLLSRLRRGGVIFVGHSESLKRMNLPLELIAPTSYRKT